MSGNSQNKGNTNFVRVAIEFHNNIILSVNVHGEENKKCQ